MTKNKQKMTTQIKNKDEISDFFECLGEIWRDITAIEFLMRAAIAKKDGEVKKFPQPPYEKGKTYPDYPASFSIAYFGEVAEKFNEYFPELAFPQELINLRNAMAHGIIAQINGDNVEQLVKFRKAGGELMVEFNMKLELARIAQIRQSLKEIRRNIGKEIDENRL